MASPSSCQGKDDDLEAGYVEHDFSKYLTLYRATVQGNWEEAQKFLEQHNNNAILAPLNFHLNTALHVAAKAGDASLVEKLVAMLPDEALGIKNRYGLTPLHFAARFGNTEVAKILVGRNYNLLYESCNKGLFPIHYAACNTRNSKEVYRYFSDVTKADGQPNPYAGPTGATILVNLITSEFYDMAMELVDKYPDLTRHQTLDKETTPLDAIVKYDYPIINKTSLSFWQTSIYYLMSSKSIINKTPMHQQKVKLLKCLCQKLKTLDQKQVFSIVAKALLQAVRLDIDEVILNIVEAYPSTAYYQDDKEQQNILFIAVENRCENAFNLVCGTSALMQDLVDGKDKNGNNIVHLAGKLAPPHKLNLVSGAALQMQRELQWFKEVQEIAPPYFSSLTNKDHKTPDMVFTDEHKELKMGGEKWTKDTATSCTIAAALIVTVVFAAAITVPGGNSNGEITVPEGFNGTITLPVGSNVSNIFLGGYNGTITLPRDKDKKPPKEGLPIFSKRDAFIIFYISNGASLFTSVTSLLLFLSILTSRYAEEDFLYALPTRLIIGLFTLLLSIMFMMAAFSTTVYLVFGKRSRGVRIILIVVACVPVTSFVVLQFRLLVVLLSSTYGRGIFKKRDIPQKLF